MSRRTQNHRGAGPILRGLHIHRDFPIHQHTLSSAVHRDQYRGFFIRRQINGRL